MWRTSLMVVFLTVVLDLISFGIIVPLLPLYAQQFGASPTEIGLLFLAFSGMQVLFSPFWGRVSDHVGRRPVLLLSTAGNVVALLLCAYAHNLLWLMLARVLAGICTSTVSVANAYVADVTSLENRTQGMGMVGAAFGIGFVIGPALGGLFVGWGMSAPFYAAAVLAACNFVLACIFLPESLALEQRQTKWVWRHPGRLALLRRSAILRRLCSIGFLHITAFSMLEMSFVLFLNRRLQLGGGANASRIASLYFLWIGVILVLVQGGLIGPLLRWFGSERRVVVLGLGAVTLGMWLMPMTPVGGFLWLAFFVACAAFGQATANPALSSLVSSEVTSNGRGTALGIYQSMLAMGRVVGPPIAGVVFDLWGENAPYWFAGGLMLAALALGLYAMRLQNSADKVVVPV